MRPELVIFDCDGVLVDSEPIACRVLLDMLRELGLAYDYERTVHTFVGRSMKSTLEVIAAELGRDVSEEFRPEYARRSFAAFTAELRPVPGVPELLPTLALPSCVASSGGHATIRHNLGLAGLLHHFEGRIFSAADVPRGKPFPDLFLHAAATMGATPDRCVVVEDSALGVRAGRAAGMRVLGYTGTFPAAVLEAEGAIAFHDMAELPALLG